MEVFRARRDELGPLRQLPVEARPDGHQPGERGSGPGDDAGIEVGDGDEFGDARTAARRGGWERHSIVGEQALEHVLRHRRDGRGLGLERVGGEEDAFENQPMAWQTATVYFAVIELVAAVGLWLATPWGAVVWLTTVVSMAVIELMFPGIYGGSLMVVGLEAVMLGAYLALAWMAARERPP